VAARLRAEGVDPRGTGHALGTTLRTLLRYETPRWRRWSGGSALLDLGDEVDGMISFRAPWNQSFGLEVARYRADRHATDTTKWILWSEVRLTPLGDSQ
jgi:hypothetical protein